MTNHSEEVQHWHKLLDQHRRNARTLRSQLAMYSKGDEPLSKLNQLSAAEDAIREAKVALRKLGEEVDQLPGDPEEDQVSNDLGSASQRKGEAEEQKRVRQELEDRTQVESLPQINASPHISLTTQERVLLQHVHQGSGQVLIEKEFGGGYSGTRVFLVLPVRPDGASDARLVTKIGPAEALRREQDNYQSIVGRTLPFTAAQVRDYTEKDGQAALNYVFVGGETLGQAVSLEEYYHASPADVVIQTLQGLLDQALAPRWYRQSQALNRPFRDEYGRHLPPHEELEKITAAVFPKLSLLPGDRIRIPGVSDEYPHPLKVYSRMGDQTLEGRQSFVHGDLHLRNVLVDQTGKGWLIDFAKVTQRHNLFDFIKLETYIRLMALAAVQGSFSWNEYLLFEQALLGLAGNPLANDDLRSAYRIIVSIREIAGRCMSDARNLHREYLPALFLYCLAMMKYYPSNGAVPTQLMFLTACALAQRLTANHVPGTAQPVSMPESVAPQDRTGSATTHENVGASEDREAVASLPSKGMLVYIHNFGSLPSNIPPEATVIDWSNEFDRSTTPRKVPSPAEWAGKLMPELYQLPAKIGQRGWIRLQGTAALSVGFAFGCLFQEVGHYQIEVEQFASPGPEYWRSDTQPPAKQAVEFAGSMLGGNPEAPDGVVIVHALPNQPLDSIVRGVGCYLGEEQVFESLVSKSDAHYNTGAIRQSLIEAFSDQDLRNLSYDHNEFRPVYEQLATDSGKAAIAQMLVEFTEQQMLFEELFDLVKRKNPRYYALHEAELRQRAQSTKFKGVLLLEAKMASEGKRPLASWEAIALARASRRQLKDWVSQIKLENLHLFLATPLGLAVFLGHQWNAIGKKAQCYEWLGGDDYAPACLVHLS